jgi:hypothetical protein
MSFAQHAASAVFQVQCAVRLLTPSSFLGSQPIYLDMFPISHNPFLLFAQYVSIHYISQERIMCFVGCHVSEHKT